MLICFAGLFSADEPCVCESHKVVGEGASAQHAGGRVRPRPGRLVGQRRRQACRRRLLFPWLRWLPGPSPQGKIDVDVYRYKGNSCRSVLELKGGSETFLSVCRFASLRSRTQMCSSCRWTMRSTSLCATAFTFMFSPSSGSTGEHKAESAASAVLTQL